jgi:hypothetical protein
LVSTFSHPVAAIVWAIIANKTMRSRCQKQGCRKCSRWATPFCQNHGRKEQPVKKERKNATCEVEKKKDHVQQVGRTQEGYFREFVVGDKVILEKISRYIDDYISTMEADALARGSRAFSYVKDAPTLKPFLEEIVNEARARVAFPLSKSTVYAEKAGISIAPPNTTRSNAWTCGAVHRDFNDVDQSGVYVFLLCVDEMTVDNGAIRFWRGSKNCRVDKRNPKRALKKLKQVPNTLVGKKGTVFVFDARLVHEPLPNKTDTRRVLLGWQVSKPSVELSDV